MKVIAYSLKVLGTLSVTVGICWFLLVRTLEAGSDTQFIFLSIGLGILLIVGGVCIKKRMMDASQESKPSNEFSVLPTVALILAVIPAYFIKNISAFNANMVMGAGLIAYVLIIVSILFALASFVSLYRGSRGLYLTLTSLCLNFYYIYFLAELN